MHDDRQPHLHRQLHELRSEHRVLDSYISELTATPYPNQLELRRLKKRKLQLKEAITRLESRLIPDLNA